MSSLVQAVNLSPALAAGGHANKTSAAMPPESRPIWFGTDAAMCAISSPVQPAPGTDRSGSEWGIIRVGYDKTTLD
jgi:hypothetical protein